MLSSLRNETYRVHLPVFEGPLDLLLQLIEREKLDISSVSLAQVTDQFIEHIRTRETVQPQMLADFLVVAARLICIKSRLLLPQAQPDGEEVEEDPGEALARQLREYKRFHEAARALQTIEASGLKAYTRLAGPPELERHLEAGGLSLEDLLAAAQSAFAVLPPEPPAVNGVVTPYTITIQDQIGLVARLTADNKAVTFRSLLQHVQRRAEIAVTLLAVLELIKRNLVVAEQDELFGEIVIRPIEGMEIATLGGLGE